MSRKCAHEQARTKCPYCKIVEEINKNFEQSEIIPERKFNSYLKQIKDIYELQPDYASYVFNLLEIRIELTFWNDHSSGLLVG